MSEHGDIDVRAGEYVLGTLDAAERVVVARDRQTDAQLDAAIIAWERRLAPMADDVRPAAPPAGLYARIERQIEVGGAGRSGDDQVVALKSRVRRWQFATAAATSLAAALAGAVVFRDVLLPPRPQSFVGAFVANDALPRFMLTIDLSTRELTIRPIGADRLEGKTYQLWIASDQLGAAPRSLGVLDDGSAALQRRMLHDYDPALLRTATFGVSIEDAGGSRSGRPAAGALHAKLVPVAP